MKQCKWKSFPLENNDTRCYNGNGATITLPGCEKGANTQCDTNKNIDIEIMQKFSMLPQEEKVATLAFAIEILFEPEASASAPGLSAPVSQ